MPKVGSCTTSRFQRLHGSRQRKRLSVGDPDAAWGSAPPPSALVSKGASPSVPAASSFRLNRAPAFMGAAGRFLQFQATGSGARRGHAGDCPRRREASSFLDASVGFRGGARAGGRAEIDVPGL